MDNTKLIGFEVSFPANIVLSLNEKTNKKTVFQTLIYQIVGISKNTATNGHYLNFSASFSLLFVVIVTYSLRVFLRLLN